MGIWGYKYEDNTMLVLFIVLFAVVFYIVVAFWLLFRGPFSWIERVVFARV